MGRWTVAGALMGMVIVAAILFAATVSLLRPHVLLTKPDPSSTETREAIGALRFDDPAYLESLVRCRRTADLSRATIDAIEDAALDKNTAAQYALGVVYLTGHGVRCNPDRALDNLIASADQDFPPALYLLGVMNEFGRDGTSSFDSAASFYERAARGGSLDAMRHFAELILKGDIAGRDDQAAIDWLTEAANRGDTRSQLILGRIYGAEGGFDVEPSPASAYYWFAIAAQLGDEEAPDLRNAAARDLDLDDLDEANRRAEAWRPLPSDREANADFYEIVQRFVPSPELSKSGEPESSSTDTPAS